jgi:hypothetical protein
VIVIDYYRDENARFEAFCRAFDVYPTATPPIGTRATTFGVGEAHLRRNCATPPPA